MFDAAPRPELLALLAAAKADPADDTPKLVLADWLQEQDHDADRARGEFVRLAVEYRRREADGRAGWDFSDRAAKLWEHYHPAWLGPLPAAGFNLWNTSAPACVLLSTFIDGDRLILRAARDLAGSEHYAWVSELCFNRIGGGQLQKFADSPLLESLASIRMEGCRVTRSALDDLVSSPRAARLRALDLARVPCPNTLGTSPPLSGLRELRLRRTGIDDLQFAVLCDSPHLNELRSLSVTNGRLGVAAARAFARRTGLPALVELDLSHNWIRGEAAVALANAPNLGNLRRLVLTGNKIGKMAAGLLRERFGDRVVLDEVAAPR